MEVTQKHEQSGHLFLILLKVLTSMNMLNQRLVTAANILQVLYHFRTPHLIFTSSLTETLLNSPL